MRGDLHVDDTTHRGDEPGSPSDPVWFRRARRKHDGDVVMFIEHGTAMSVYHTTFEVGAATQRMLFEMGMPQFAAPGMRNPPRPSRRGSV